MKKFFKIFLWLTFTCVILIGFNFLYKYYKTNQLPLYYKKILDNSNKTNCDYKYIEYMNSNNIININSGNPFEYECPEKYAKTYIPKLLCTDGITIEMKNWCKHE